MRFTASAFRKLLSVYVFSYFPFGFEGRMWDLIVSVSDHCLSFYFTENHLFLIWKQPFHRLKYLKYSIYIRKSIYIRIGRGTPKT